MKSSAVWLPLSCKDCRGSHGRESACNAGDPSSIPGWGRSLGERNGSPLQYSWLANPMDRGVWWVLQFTGWQRLGYNWASNTFTFISSLPCTSLRRRSHLPTPNHISALCPHGTLCTIWVNLDLPRRRYLQMCQGFGVFPVKDKAIGRRSRQGKPSGWDERLTTMKTEKKRKAGEGREP